MKKTSAVVMVILMMVVTSCGGKKSSKSGPVTIAQPTSPAEPDPTDPPNPPDTDTPDTDTSPPSGNIPPQALSFKVNFGLQDMDETQTEKFSQASEIIKRVVASDSFRDQIVNYTYNGVKRFVKNKGLSNEKIYLAILDGAEKLTPAKDNTMSLNARLYTATFPEMSYSYANTLLISINTAYFDKITAVELAGRMTHHWLHKLGFDYKNTTPEAKLNSVPVAVSKILQDIGQND